MNKTTVRRNLALAVCLGALGGAVLAKGPDTQVRQDQSARNNDCVSISQASSTTAKSPQSTLSHSCTPTSSPAASVPAGATATKTPSRSGGSGR